MSRIIGGAAGGHQLQSVAGSATRPTTDRVKESLFARLDHWDAIAGCRVLDLFAGSGALGLEALSRGAHRATLVDLSEGALKAARANANKVSRALGNRSATVVKGKAPGILRSLPGPWDLVFVDPPYTWNEEELAECLRELAPVLDAGAIVVVERSTRSPEPEWPAVLERFDERAYGETRLWFAEPV